MPAFPYFSFPYFSFPYTPAADQVPGLNSVAGWCEEATFSYA